MRQLLKYHGQNEISNTQQKQMCLSMVEKAQSWLKKVSQTFTGAGVVTECGGSTYCCLICWQRLATNGFPGARWGQGWWCETLGPFTKPRNSTYAFKIPANFEPVGLCCLVSRPRTIRILNVFNFYGYAMWAPEKAN